MGLFGKKEKVETTEQKVKRLSQNAGNIVEMLKAPFRGPKGLDITGPVIYAAGLSGIASHEAVKALNGSFQQVGLNDNRKFYFGDDVNKYLMESVTSVYSFINAVAGMSQDELTELVRKAANSLGDDEFTILTKKPDHLYREIKDCWDGIFDNMTSRYCKSPDEWPILFSIVLQNLITTALSVGAPKEEVRDSSMMCALVLSKMDNDSLLAE